MFGDASFWILIAIGLVAGVVSGMFGVGGGLVIVPALVFFLGYSQHTATGTSLAVLLPPIGLAAVIEHHSKNNVNFYAAILIAILFVFGSYIGAKLANQLNGSQLKLGFGIFLFFVSLYYIYTAAIKLRTPPNPEQVSKRVPEVEQREPPDEA